MTCAVQGVLEQFREKVLSTVKVETLTEEKRGKIENYENVLDGHCHGGKSEKNGVHSREI